MNRISRRNFLHRSGRIALGAGLLGGLSGCRDFMNEKNALAINPDPKAEDGLFFNISLAEWSLHKSLWAGKMDHLDFAEVSRKQFGISAIEYVNQFFRDKAEDTAYLNQMNQRAADNGVSQNLIMIDLEGSLATLDEPARKKAVENHYKWVHAAKYLGCHTIRVNAAGKGDRQAVMAAAIDSLGQLATYAAQEEINVVVENHGGYSSDASWLSEVMRQVNLPNCGTLPDFGNFTLSLFPYQTYDRYQGLKELMPFAKGVSAKTHDFDSQGREKTMDYQRMLAIVREAGYIGHVGIEYEGYKLSERAGILASKQLLTEAGR